MPPRSIVVAFDGTPESTHALQEAADLARLVGARLSIVGVVPLVSSGFGTHMPTGEGVTAALAATRSLLDAERARLEASGVAHVESEVLEGDPVAAVVGYVEKRSVDLVVVGSRGLDAVGRFFLGSVSDGILHYAGCSVLVVKPARSSDSGRR